MYQTPPSIKLIYSFLTSQSLCSVVLLKMLVVMLMIKHCVHINIQMMVNQQINPFQIL